MNYFAGLDVSLEETTICIVDEAGKIVREARVASEPEALVAFFGACGLKIERVGLEACSLTAWLHTELTKANIPAICIEARQAKAAMGAMPNKTDRNDARGIAQIMRTGWYRAVHVKSPSCRSWRALLTARRMVLNKRRDVENGIRALLREVGLKVGTPSRKAFAARVRELAAGDPALTSLSESLLSVIEVMTREADRLTKRVMDEVTCRAHLPPVDDGTRRRPRHRVGVPRHHRPTGPLSKVARRWRASRPDATALSIRRDRRTGSHQPVRRRTGSNRAVRSGSFAAHPQYQMVGVAGVGHEHRQTPGHGACSCRGRPQAGGDPAPYVGRWQRVPLG
jgi:transposase